MRLKYHIEQYAEHRKLELVPGTIRRNLDTIFQLCLFFRNPELKTLTPEDIVNYLNLQLELGWAHNGIVMKSSVLRSFWKWLNKMGLPTFHYDLIPNMKKIWVKPRVANEEDYQKVLKAIGTKRFYDIRDRAIVMFLWDTGARNGEIVSLNAADLNLKDMKATIRTEKSRGMRPFREIFWTEETNEALKTWLETRQKYIDTHFCESPEALFIGSTNNWQGRRLTVSGIGIALRRHSNKAKVPTLNPHSFRHHMGHDLASKGANNSIISSILGHSSLQSSFRYTDLDDQERERAYKKYKRG